MYSIKRISKNIAGSLKAELKLEDEKYEVIEYGLHGLFHMIASILLVVIFGAIFGVLVESLLISFTIAILRKSSGGVHASTELTCGIIGVIISVIPAIILKNIDNVMDISVKGAIILNLSVFLLSFLLVYKLAPVDSPNKPIKSEKKIKRLKRGSLITLGIYMMLVIISILLNIKMDAEIFKIYSLCISFGVLWQSFTLTKLGHIVLNLMDSFFIKVLGNKGGN